MNLARLVGGWLLLCGLSAGGAYFAMDEVDRRYDLSKYDLRAKVGLSSVPAQPPVVAPGTGPQPAPVQPGGGSQGPGGSPAPIVAPPPQPAPAPSSGTKSPAPIVTPVQPAPSGGGSRAPVQPGGGRSIPAPAPSGGSAPQPIPTARGGQISGSGQGPAGRQQPVQPAAPGRNPVGGNPPVGGGTGNPNPQVPVRPVQPAPAPPTPSPASPTNPTAADPRNSDDLRQLRDFYNQLSPRAEAVLANLDQMKRQTEINRGVFRVDLQTAMLSLRDALARSKRALDTGDADGARSYLGTAYQQLQYLEQNRR